MKLIHIFNKYFKIQLIVKSFSHEVNGSSWTKTNPQAKWNLNQATYKFLNLTPID